MASRAAKSSSRKNLIKNFYKPTNDSKMNAMAINDSITAVKIPTGINLASGYPMEFGEEWYSQVDEYYSKQDEGRSILSR